MAAETGWGGCGVVDRRCLEADWSEDWVTEGAHYKEPDGETPSAGSFHAHSHPLVRTDDL